MDQDGTHHRLDVVRGRRLPGELRTFRERDAKPAPEVLSDRTYRR
jgi:hypothetical protein